MASKVCIFALGLLGVFLTVQGDGRVDQRLEGLGVNASTPSPLCACNCNCGRNQPQSADNCEWKRVFKAVAGNGRSVLDDFLLGGDINSDVPEANMIETAMPFRDPVILDGWTELDIKQVRVEVFEIGVRKSWYVFDGQGSNKKSWFSRDRLINSPYGDIKSGTYNFFDIDGDSTVNRHFYINRRYGGCPNDCGFLDVVDTNAPKRVCLFDKRGEYPYFLYGKKTGTCSNKQRTRETGKGDRFVISVNICN